MNKNAGLKDFVQKLKFDLGIDQVIVNMLLGESDE